ncbi:MAG: imelysin family protein [Bacteroidota bacterium]
MKKIVITLLASILFLVNCSDDSNGDNFDRGPILSNLADAIILPGYRQLSQDLNGLSTAINTFNSERSIVNLDALKDSWKVARLSWKSIELYRFGPIEDRFLFTKMDIYPVSASGIEEVISAYDGSANYIVPVASTSRGFGAIEYMLFSDSEAVTLTSFDDENRRSYLALVAENLGDNINTVITEWENGYTETFKAGISNDVGSGITRFTNAMLQHIEDIKNFKVETPLGLRTDSDPIPEDVESPYANISAEMIVTNMNAIETAFTGGQGQSLDDYLNELNASGESGNRLSDDIITKIDECRTLAQSIDNLAVAVETGDQTANNLLVALQELTTLTKSDMMSQLGLLITFSSTDGDS